MSSPTANLRDLIAALQLPDAYAHATTGVTLIETHISYVLLAGEFAYKVKKPVDFGFVDYSTLERRRLMCEEEVRLNRRLCAGVYIGVVPITRDRQGAFRVDGQSEVVEYAVKMRRVPDADTLPSMLASRRFSSQLLGALASRIARFHRETPTSEPIAAFGTPEAIRENWNENFSQTDRFVGRTIQGTELRGIQAFVDDYLTRHATLLAARADAGRVRDCHGDLRADSVVFGPGNSVCVMDCIEFNERLRHGDVASDVAFFAMDLEARGYRGVAEAFISAYMGQVDDETLTLVLNFYRSYRAYVRGKVESLLSEEGEVQRGRRRQALVNAARYFQLSFRYARSRSPTMVVVGGLSGSGKSWLASPLAARMSAALVRSDWVRRDMKNHTPGNVPYGEGDYSDPERHRVYEEMKRRALYYLRAGNSVVLDAAYYTRQLRDEVKRAAEQAQVPFLLVEVVADEATIRERLQARVEGAAVVSDARWETYLAQRERFASVHELTDAEHVRVESRDNAVDQLVDLVMSRVGDGSDTAV
jgi:aminoglycoside phosphotransferase family enzyme/predicted kinase